MKGIQTPQYCNTGTDTTAIATYHLPGMLDTSCYARMRSADSDLQQGVQQELPHTVTPEACKVLNHSQTM